MANEYYGAPTTPTSDYLAHYGVKGMKWGVRKAIESGNTRKLARQFRKAEKKLAKLEKLGANGKKYAKRAAGYGVGAAAAGGLAAAGTGGVGRAMKAVGGGAANLSERITRGSRNKHIRNVSQAINTAGRAVSTAGGSVAGWGKGDSISRAIRRPMVNAAVANGGTVGKGLNSAQGALRGVSNNTIARIGAGAIGAGLGVASARNAYRAATAKKHAQQAAAFRKEMQNAFKGTQYANQIGQTRKRKRR